MRPLPDSLFNKFTVFKTSDPDEFKNYVASYDGVVDRHLVDSGPLDVELRHAKLEKFSVGLFISNVTMIVTSQRKPSDDYLLQFPLTGSIDIELNGRDYFVNSDQGVLIGPGVRVRRIGSPGRVLIFSIPVRSIRSRIEERIARSIGGPLSFQPLLNASARQIREFGLMAVRAVEDGVIKLGEAAVEVFEKGLVDLLLDLQPHNFASDLVAQSIATRSTRIDLVEDYVTKRPQEALTMKELTAIAGCSERVLQSAFIELCGMTPLQFVKRKRLSMARDLLESSGFTGSVAEVLLKTGIRHAARFAADYKLAYGELPSETLLRVRKVN